MNRFLQPHHHYRLTVLLAFLWAGLMMPLTATQAIDITVEPRATVGVMIYQYEENYSEAERGNIEWKDTSPFFGVGSTISIATNFCERLFIDAYGQFTDAGSDGKFSQAKSERGEQYQKDESVDFGRRDWVGTMGCVIPQRIFLDGSVTLTAGYKGGKSEINGTHRQYRPKTVTPSPEDSTILKTDGFFGGVSLSWPIRSTWQFQINLANAWLQSEFNSAYHSIINPPTTGDTGGFTGGIRIQNTLTRHVTWSISADWFRYKMDANPPEMEINGQKGRETLTGVKEQIIPLRASLIWRF